MNMRERKKRQAEGRARAKAEGRPCGPPTYGAYPVEKEILDRIVYWRASNGSGKPRKIPLPVTFLFL
jgi:DNA invertase Pin-like site-specific DNA recombinase